MKRVGLSPENAFALFFLSLSLSFTRERKVCRRRRNALTGRALATFVPRRRSSSRTPTSSFSQRATHPPFSHRRGTRTVQSPPFSLSFAAPPLAPVSGVADPSSAAFRLHPGPTRIHIPRPGCLTLPPPPHHPQVVNTRTDAYTRAHAYPRRGSPRVRAAFPRMSLLPSFLSRFSLPDTVKDARA